MTGMERLAMIMRVQAVTFGVYGLALFLIPEFLLDTVFGWENPELFWARAAGIPLIGVSLLEWSVVSRIESRTDLVWPFVAIPGLYVFGFLGSQFADELSGQEGYEGFFWLTFGVATFFFVALSWARAVADR